MSTEVNFRMVRLAREFRSVTQREAASAATLPQARLSRLESGQLVATQDDVEALSVALGFPTDFFIEPGIPAAVPLFRKRAIRSTKTLSTIQARLNTAVLIAHRVLDSGIEFECPLTLPDPGEYAADQPEAAATAIRRAWRLPHGAVDDVTELIEAAGGIVLRVDFGTDDASAAYVGSPFNGRQWFLVNTRETAGDRVRLSLAHELGHAILHRRLAQVEESETERQAFAFASAFLLPGDSFDRQVPFDALTLSQARRLKVAFGVSIQAIVRAAHDRQRISRARYTSLYKQISARQWRTVEPDPIAIEQPRAWDAALEIHRRDHGYSDRDLAGIARVSPELLNDLFPEHFAPAERPGLRVMAASEQPLRISL